MTDSISARQRWAESHFLRISVISQLFEEFGLSKKEDITRDLKNYKIKADNIALESIKTMVWSTMNPNLGSGKTVSHDT